MSWVIKWYVDASFAVHPDFKSHTGATMMMGTGAIQSASMKQKLNTRSSTEAEIVGVDDIAPKIFWTKLFLEAQGYQVEKNILPPRYLNGTKKYHLTLSADDLHVIKWFVDASFAVHPDFRSHTGASMMMGSGAIQSASMKQKLNTRSSTEAEIVGVDDIAPKIFWTKLFMEAQGYGVQKNILFQDNKSSILLETNGRKSAGKRSRAMNIRYFFITDQVNKGNVTIEHCPTEAMVADFMTKPLQGTKFRSFRKAILGM